MIPTLPLHRLAEAIDAHVPDARVVHVEVYGDCLFVRIADLSSDNQLLPLADAARLLSDREPLVRQPLSNSFRYAYRGTWEGHRAEVWVYGPQRVQSIPAAPADPLAEEVRAA